MRTSRLSKKGQVTIPKAIREAVDLEPGDVITYEVGDGIIRIRRREPVDTAFHEELTKTLDEWNSPEDEEAFRDL